MKNEWEKIYDEPMKDELKAQIMERALPVLEQYRAQRQSKWAWLFKPALGLATVGALTIVVYFATKSTQQVAEISRDKILTEDFAMIADADLLLDLQTLENADLFKKMEKNTKWPKRKS